MSGIFWWIRQVVFVLACCFFLVFGINLLISAYQLKDPAYFLMTFFSSNLIILISAALLIGFICQMFARHKGAKDVENTE